MKLPSSEDIALSLQICKLPTVNKFHITYNITFWSTTKRSEKVNFYFNTTLLKWTGLQGLELKNLIIPEHFIPPKTCFSRLHKIILKFNNRENYIMWLCSYGKVNHRFYLDLQERGMFVLLLSFESERKIAKICIFATCYSTCRNNFELVGQSSIKKDLLAKNSVKGTYSTYFWSRKEQPLIALEKLG